MTERFEEAARTLLVAIVDESGSMASQRQAVLDGLNDLVRTQQQGPDPAKLMVVAFNTARRTVLEATDLAVVEPFQARDYNPSGGTALLDAVLTSIQEADALRQPDERVLVQIVTDGEENASKRATPDAVKAAITACEATGRWTFVYIGPNPEGWSRATGTQDTNSAQYTARKETYLAMASMATNYRGQSLGTVSGLTTSGEAQTLLDPSNP